VERAIRWLILTLAVLAPLALIAGLAAGYVLVFRPVPLVPGLPNREPNMANALMAIHPYRHNGLWVFDDDRVGLVREPFVSGMPEIIDAAVERIPNADKGFTLLFSATPFPGATVELDWVREEFLGNWYRETKTGREGWLCPALFKYFDAAPPKLYAQPLPKKT
jgi:hypothetical protein